LGKIPENPNKIPKYLGKIPENLGKMAPKVCRKTREDPVFGRSHHKNRRQKLHDNVFGKFGKIWAKIFCTPKNLLAPTTMCQTINNGSTTSWHTGTFAY